ncbi:MAG TPA: hypothetical protein VKT75_10890 [Acidobacteriaceae bacterium]|nr:hypothetical protein [Acidobacteriaceae bacterium]
MLATAWLWVRVVGLAVGIGALWLGFAVLEDDDRSGLRFVSYGAGMVFVSVAATFLAL